MAFKNSGTTLPFRSIWTLMLRARSLHDWLERGAKAEKRAGSVGRTDTIGPRRSLGTHMLRSLSVCDSTPFGP